MPTAALRFGDINTEGTPTREVALPLTPGSCTPDHVVDALTQAGVTAADIRSHAELDLDATLTTADVLTTLSVIYGLTGRWVRTVIDGNAEDFTTIADQASELAHSFKRKNPAVTYTDVQVDPHGAPPEVSTIRFAPNVTLLPGSPAELVSKFVFVSALRFRRTEHFPNYLPAPGEEEIHLDKARRAGGKLRADTRPKVGNHLAPEADLPDRLRDMAAAGRVDIDKVMTALGAVHNTDEDRWHCPRPQRHTNGDRTPSMMMYDDNTTQCFRCDAEHVDPVRLVADSLNITGDEAVVWIREHIPA